MCAFVLDVTRRARSCNDAPPLLDHLAPLAAHALLEREVEHLAYVVARLGGALDVLGADLARDGDALLGRDRHLPLCAQHPPRLLIPP